MINRWATQIFVDSPDLHMAAAQVMFGTAASGFRDLELANNYLAYVLDWEIHCHKLFVA